MRFSLSDAKCEVKVVIEVDDEKHPVHGYKACVDEADIRDSTTNRPVQAHNRMVEVLRKPKEALWTVG